MQFRPVVDTIEMIWYFNCIIRSRIHFFVAESLSYIVIYNIWGGSKLAKLFFRLIRELSRTCKRARDYCWNCPN